MLGDDKITRQRDAVIAYYKKTESLFGYKYIMGGTKHFGHYEPGQSALPFEAALRRMEKLLAEKLNVAPDERVLDAGCGTGVVACEVAARTGAKISGIDILDFNLEAARERAGILGLEDSVDFSFMDYAELTFEDETFDAVYTMETLVHSIDPRRVLGQFHRVLKPGGRLVMFEYSRTDPSAMPKEAKDTFQRVNQLAAMPAFQNVFYHGALAELILSTGFKDVRATDLTENVMPMLKAFRDLARVPYFILRKLGKESKAVNAMSAVEFYKYQRFFKYELYEAIK